MIRTKLSMSELIGKKCKNKTHLRLAWYSICLSILCLFPAFEFFPNHPGKVIICLICPSIAIVGRTALIILCIINQSNDHNISMIIPYDIRLIHNYRLHISLSLTCSLSNFHDPPDRMVFSIVSPHAMRSDALRRHANSERPFLHDTWLHN